MRVSSRMLRRTAAGWSLGLLVVAASWPVVAAAKEPDAVLYELNEEAQFTPSGHRKAMSGLQGTAIRGTPLCPDGLIAYAQAVFASLGIDVQDAVQCTVVAFGESRIKTFASPPAGTIDGRFDVVLNSDATNLTDAPELRVMAGKFNGSVVVQSDGLIIDIPGATFTPTSILHGFPGGVPPPATFTGKFRLPFTMGGGSAFYEMDDGSLAPVLPNEHALGYPTVRVEITFD